MDLNEAFYTRVWSCDEQLAGIISFFPWKKFWGKWDGRLEISVLKFATLENS